MDKKKVLNTPEFLNVQKTADFLGVHAGTVRRWVHTNQLRGVKVGLRGDWRFTKEDILKMVNDTRELHVRDDIQEVSLQEISSSHLAPHADWSQMSSTAHFVQFYETDKFLLDSLAGFIGEGLRKGEIGIIIATKAHRESLDVRLKSQGLDLVTARKQGAYIVLDAAEILSQFMVEGMPDAEKFSHVIGDLLVQASQKATQIRAFGEMVAQLWTEGNQAGAIYLEELWNSIGKNHSFSLFCAYPMQGFDRESHGSSFTEIGTRHSHVIPADSYSGLATSDERLRAISLLQQKAESLEAEIQERKRLEKQKDEFLALASHELKTPLTSLKGYSQVAHKRAERNGDIDGAKFLVKMDKQINKLTDLVGDLLDVTKVTAGRLDFQMQEFDFGELIEEVVEAMQSTTDKQQLVMKGKVSKIIMGDRERIGQVVTNLLSNAIKYSPNAQEIIITQSEEEGKVQLAVHDFGIGIGKIEQERIFDQFYREPGETKTFPGLGLGLYISKEIIARHNGHIWVESPPRNGQDGNKNRDRMTTSGSIFNFTLPVTS
ncbi:hypothetical protein BH11PAT1_BH11PAT1_4750 [soil metagenome]